MRSPPSVARLKVTLNEVEPAVVRRLEVPLDLRLDRLHLVLQAALGWTNSHLWEFRTRDVGWGLPDPEWDRGSGPLDVRKATLLKVVEDTGAKTLTYLYDFSVLSRSDCADERHGTSNCTGRLALPTTSGAIFTPRAALLFWSRRAVAAAALADYSPSYLKLRLVRTEARVNVGRGLDGA